MSLSMIGHPGVPISKHPWSGLFSRQAQVRTSVKPPRRLVSWYSEYSGMVCLIGNARGPYSLVVLHKDSFHVPINDLSSWGPDFKASVEEHISSCV
jgi:hypothetical protein